MSLNSPTEIAVFAICAILAITFHEAAHGFVALHFGDTTAKDAGRVTLNPIKHIDLFGTILLPLLLYVTAGFIFGYAKPVPVNFSALSNPRWNMIWVAAAGPATAAGASPSQRHVLRQITIHSPPSEMSTSAATGHAATIVTAPGKFETNRPTASPSSSAKAPRCVRFSRRSASPPRLTPRC